MTRTGGPGLAPVSMPDWPRPDAWSNRVAVERADAPLRVPVATYRLQFGQGFGFEAAARVVPYLAALGVTECYASPLLTAGPGSTHGYDICDHERLNPELGDERAQAALFGALREFGLGLLVDFVPNHMGIDPRRNRWWRDVLENGPSSPYAEYFDIDWAPVKPELLDKVLLPVLGDQYGAVLERGELRLAFEDGLLELRYFDMRLPINPRQATRVYRLGLDGLRAELGDHHPNLRELMSIITALDHLPVYTDRDPDRIVERQREKEVSRERLARLVSVSGRIRAHIEAAVRRFNGTPGDPASFDLLHDLLEAQAYRLAYWRTATDEINYRRFFDVNDLAALRMEDERVFRATHSLLLDLVERGVVTGVRVDHPDGLYDPATYLARLQLQAGARLARSGRGGDAAAPANRPRPLYVVAEKILSQGERLRDDWPIHGTTGYDFLNALNGLFVNGEGVSDLRRVFQRFTGQRELPGDLIYACKRLIMHTTLSSELNVLAHAFNRLSESDRRSRDFTLDSLRRALMEVVACFPVYRTYVTAGGASEEDARTIDAAIAEARRRNPSTEPSIFAFIRRILLGRGGVPAGDGGPVAAPDGSARTAGGPAEGGPPVPVEAARRAVELAHRVQQYTGPVEAKGVEDTAFYRDVALVSTNEVGGDLRQPACSPEAFHEASARRLARWPFAMLATATHDTKRGEDVRARLNVISEVPDRWRRAVSAWARLNAGSRMLVDGSPAPDRQDEYLFYQTVAGVWPAERLDEPVPGAAPDDLVRRLSTYMLKAVREAKRHTSWVSPNAAYEAAVERFVEAVLRGSTARRFLSQFVPFQRRLGFFGAVNSLAQVVIKVASPGVPDFYQGCELWDLNLVDPDNRRQVDFSHRAARLAELLPLLHDVERALGGAGEAGPAVADRLARLRAAWPDERAKLWTTLGALRLRRARPELFLLGTYRPLFSADGSARLLAFAREWEGQIVVAVVPRRGAAAAWDAPVLPIGRETWGETRIAVPAALASRQVVNALTGTIVPVAREGDEIWMAVGDALASWPVALLVAR